MKKAVRILALLFVFLLILSACTSTKQSEKEMPAAVSEAIGEVQAIAELQTVEEPAGESPVIVEPQVPEVEVMVVGEPTIPDAMPSDEEDFLPLKIEPPVMPVVSEETPVEVPDDEELQDNEGLQDNEKLPALEETPNTPNTTNEQMEATPQPEPQPPQSPESVAPESVERVPEAVESIAESMLIIEETETEVEETETLTPLPPVLSRTANIEVNQYLDIPYRGSGWVYLGEQEYPGLVSYIDRKRIGVDTVFTIRADKPGQTVLQFYREDVLSHTESNEYFGLTITGPEAPPDTPAAATRTEVPSAPRNTPAATAANNVASAARAQTTAPPQTELQPPEMPDEIDESAPVMSSIVPPALPTKSELYDKAEQAYKAANYEEASVFIGQFLEGTNDDKGLFLKGQIYEAKSPVRDIRLALASYQQLADTFPMSLLRPDALKRITYLKKFYFTIN